MITLRPYQQAARDKARAEYARGKRAICYVSPTGSGKTVILADTIASHLKHHVDARVNVYAHRRELITQAADTFRAYGIDVGCNGLNPSAPVQVHSTQTVLARGEVSRCTMAVLDETHHYAADTWGDVAKAHRGHGAIIVGATATPERGDGRPLSHIFDSLVVVAQVKELVDIGALVPCRIIRPTRPLKAGQIAQTPKAAVQRYAQGRRVVVFAPHVKAANEFADGWATVVHGAMPADERAGVLADFKAGRLKAIVNVNVLTEGFDSPSCDCIVIARGMGSVGMFIQACGRAARPSPGKKDYLVIDLRGVSYELGRPDDDREYSLEGEGISRGMGVVAEARLCKRCGAILGDEEVCPSCGQFNGLVTPTAVGVELEAWKETIRKDDDGKRVERLARWITEARAKGHKPWSASYRFRGTYGQAPSSEMMKQALELARR